MTWQPSNPCWRISSILLVALSLSIGWGIRGNYGHEEGAMIPGALAAIAACLVSGREDWRQRVGYFAFFGALGWAFGGSISYMQVISYTHSGQYESQLYGFAGLFLIGFLWAALGGGSTALPAALPRKKLDDLFRPLAFLLSLWVILYLTEPLLVAMVANNAHDMRRQDSPLYWFDSDWLQVAVILVGILLFDLIDRRFAKVQWLVVFGAIGASLGWLVQWLFGLAGATVPLGKLLLRHAGDLTVVGKDNQPAFQPDQLVINWPNFLPDAQQHVGWALGLTLGVAVYFALYGAFRYGSSLFLHMALGWWASFLIFPVLLDIRLTPPRGDNWAGILGVFLGAVIYLLRARLTPVVLASVVCGTIGGIGFAGIAWLKLMLVSLGNPNLASDPQAVQSWQHWQSANWHSFLEQSYGFVNGLGLIAAVGLLAPRVGPLDNRAPRRRLTELLALTFVVPVLIYVNMVKTLDDFKLPERMKAPLWGSFELSAEGWFALIFAAASLALIALIAIHARRPLAIVPESWLGRGQLLYFVLLWVFVLGNFTKALPHFSEQRLLTEGVILINAVICTLLVLLGPRDSEAGPEKTAQKGAPSFARPLWAAVATLLIIAAGLPFLLTYSVRRVYGDSPAGHAGHDLRFGPDANWRVSPILKHTPHR